MNLLTIKNLKDKDAIEEVKYILMNLLKTNNYNLDIKLKYEDTNKNRIQNCIDSNGISEIVNFEIEKIKLFKNNELENNNNLWHAYNTPLNNNSNQFYYLSKFLNNNINKIEETLVIEDFDILPENLQNNIKNTMLMYTNHKNINIVEDFGINKF